jgi:tetratricopeptide (TPR) repeat protein
LALPKWVLPICSTTILLLLASLTWIQLGYWKNDLTLYRHAVDVDEDNWIAQNTLGALLGTKGRFDEAISHLMQSIRRNPAYADPYFNLGVAYYRKGDRQEAVRYYRESLRIEPGNTSRRLVLAKVLDEMGRREEAMEEYQKVLQVDPDDKKVQDLLREQSFKKSAEASSRAMGREVQRNILP